MVLSKMLHWLNPKARRAEQARQGLMANAKKALDMKQAAGNDAQIPPHQTAHEGMRPGAPNTDVSRGSQEGAFEPQLKRTKVARSGDTS